MNRHFLIAALLVVPRVSGAQTAPAEPPTESPTPDQAPPAAAPPAEPEATPPAEPTPAVKLVEPTPDDKPAVTAKYDGGVKFSTTDDQFELKLSFRNQVRFESTRSFDEESPARHNQFLNAIYIPRARLQVEGHLFGKDNRVKVEVGFGDTGSFSFLKDMFLEKRIPDSSIYVRFGQWKRPFNRPEMVSDFSSTFNERSIENELAGGGRSLGVALHNDYEKSPEGIEWALGMFNTFNGGSDRPAITTTCTESMTGDIGCTNSRPTTIPTDFGPTLVARVGFNSPKMKGYSESDVEGGPLRYAVGASYKVDLANLTKGKQPSWAENSSHGVEIDAMLKASGYSLHAGLVLMKIKSADPQFGFFLQPGMFIVPKKFEIAARFAMITVTETDATKMEFDRKQIEARAAFNYYFHGHTWKLANDVGYLKFTGDEPSKDGGDFQARMMLQLSI